MYYLYYRWAAWPVGCSLRGPRPCILCITGGQVGLWVALSEVRASCILCITGGQLGLWVGISAITMCELFDLIAKLVIYLCKSGGGKVHDEQDSTTQVKPVSPE